MPLAPNQPEYLGKCTICNASCYYLNDEEYYKWQGGDPECLHTLLSPYEPEEDEECD